MDALPCLVCDGPLPADPTARCLTACSHEFCLSCLCRVLASRKNHCPGCHAPVQRVTQLQPRGQETPKPADVRFCNAIYTLNVSIWAVKDPVQTLAFLFNLEHARLIHHGKVLTKGDVWPGAVVQLVGTQRGALQTASARSYMTWLEHEWLHRGKQILCCPLSVLYDFLRSLFGHVEGQQRGQRGYASVPTRGTSTASHFQEPGQVASPDYTPLL